MAIAIQLEQQLFKVVHIARSDVPSTVKATNMLCGSRSFGPDIKDRATCCHNSVDFARNDRANGLRQLCYKTQMTFTQTHAKIFTCAIRFETDIPDALFTASPFKLVPLWAA